MYGGIGRLTPSSRGHRGVKERIFCKIVVSSLVRGIPRTHSEGRVCVFVSRLAAFDEASTSSASPKQLRTSALEDRIGGSGETRPFTGPTNSNTLGVPHCRREGPVRVKGVGKRGDPNTAGIGVERQPVGHPADRIQGGRGGF